MKISGRKQLKNLSNQNLLPILIIALYILALAIPIILASINGGNSLKTPIITEARSLSYDSINIKWTTIKDADGYEILRYDNGTGKFSLVKTISGHPFSNGSQSICKYTDDSLVHDTGYAYSVRAYKNDLFSNRHSDKSQIASATPELSPSEIISVKNTGNSNIIVYWKHVDGIDGYELYRSQNIYEGYKKIYTSQDSDIDNYTDRNLKNGKTYHYKIRTFSYGENELITSDLSGFESEKSIGKNATELAENLQNKIEGNSTNISSVQIGSTFNGYKIVNSFRVKSYAYSGGGNTATGQKCQVGRIAVDPKVISLGTWLYVEGYGLCQACDTGGDIIGKTIDVYMNTEYECRQWGVKYPMVYILSN